MITRQQRRKLERIHNKNRKNFQYSEGIMSVRDLTTIQSDPIWVKNKERENQLRKTEGFEVCQPLEFLHKMGYEVFKTKDNLIVRVSKPKSTYDHIMESVFTPRLYTTVEDYTTQLVPISEIVDYNSLWSLTNTGWYSEEQLSPYIGIRKIGSVEEFSWFKWDNSRVLRPLCGTMNWDEKNYLVFHSFQKR